jgi:hypothetical protein
MAKIIVRDGLPTDEIYQEGVTSFFIRFAAPKPTKANDRVVVGRDRAGDDRHVVVVGRAQRVMR